MIDARRRSSLSLEELATDVAPNELGGQDLHCDTPLERDLLGDPHAAHPTFADRMKESVGSREYFSCLHSSKNVYKNRTSAFFAFGPWRGFASVAARTPRVRHTRRARACRISSG
jgi:hypothetical protein